MHKQPVSPDFRSFGPWNEYNVLFVGLILASVLLGLRILFMPVIGHDDGITLLSATCNQDLYRTDTPSGLWTNAGVWQLYWKPNPEKVLCFRTIAKDLATTDIHPPLYFWLLHIWLHIFGSGIISAAFLNIVFLVLTTVVILTTCKALNLPHYVSVVTALLWLLSPSTLEVVNTIRHYSLFAFSTSLLTLSLVLYYKEGRQKYLAHYILAATIGLLTHYQFFPVVIASSFVGALALAVKSGLWRSVYSLILGTILSLAISMLLNPAALEPVIRQQSQRQAFEVAEMAGRLSNSMSALRELFFPNRAIPGMANYLDRPALLANIVIFLIIIGVLIYSWRGLHRFFSMCLRFDEHALPLVVGAVGLSTIMLLYIFQLTPQHAMGARYVVGVTPIVFITIGQIMCNVTEKRKVFVGLLIFQCVIGTVNSLGYVVSSNRDANATFSITNDIPVLIDTTARGILPRILWHIDQSTTVYAANQNEILAEFHLNDDRPEAILYVSNLDYGNSLIGRASIKALLEDYGYQYMGQVGDIYGIAHVMLFSLD